MPFVAPASSSRFPTPAELEQFYIPFPDGDPAARIGLRLDFFPPCSRPEALGLGVLLLNTFSYPRAFNLREIYV